MLVCDVFVCWCLTCESPLLKVTIQVQDVELAGAQRQGAYLSTPCGHRVLGKQLSADNAEMHR